MKLKYAFNLGRVFTLSLAELFAVFENMEISFRLVDLYREVLIIETEEALEVAKLQKRLGGTIKIMSVIDALPRKKIQGPYHVFHDYFDIKILRDKILATTSGKLQVGVSMYPMAAGLPLRGEIKRLGLLIKDVLVKAGHSTRIVFPQMDGLSLPSVVVAGEHLLEKGAEVCFLVGFERIYLAKTLSFQNFEDYGRRDYQRPVRSTQIGMLPPKVAQIMINLALIPKSATGNSKVAVLDPFTGSGTVLQEAMLMGFKTVGSDLSPLATESAEKNLLWFKNRYQIPPNRFELITSDVAKLPEALPKLEYAAVVTEGTLGPAYSEPPPEKEMEKNFKNLEGTYLNAFRTFAKVLKSGSRVVIALPAYHIGNNYRFFPVIDKVKKLGYDVVYPVPEPVVQKYPFLQITERGSIIYDRKDQFVSREIFILKLKNGKTEEPKNT